MYELFTQLKTDNASVYKSADLDNVSSAYKRQVDTLVAYYHSKAMFVNNEHLLVRIIKLAVSSLNYSIEHYASVIDQRVPNVERHFQLCSSISTGIFHKSVFFTGCDELLISDRGYFNPHIALKNWTKLQPVKVLSSCITNLGLNMPIPRAQNSELGFKPIKHQVSVSAEVQRMVDERAKEAIAAAEAAAKQFKDSFLAALATAAAGINRNFFKDVAANPLKGGLSTTSTI
jgi:hypothetical protein